MNATSRLLNDYLRDRIRYHRMSLELLSKELAQRSRIPAGSFCCLESGHYRISVLHLLKVQIALGADIRDIWPVVKPERRDATDSTVTAVLRAAEIRAPKFTSLEDILAAVCSEFGVTVEEMASPSRERRFSRPRSAAAALVRQTPGITLQSLAQVCSRDYACIYHSLELALEDPVFWEQLRRLEERLKPTC